ncbi:MAG: UDP-N-acetylmuramate dehydrogenase [Lachnospiraceae bacterium]|nr:UDP-N-acetylmuramate dehydrogenase [Lachnospiraceae bacterium]
MTEKQKKEITELIGEENIRFEEPMNKHTTFRIGGNAECFVCVQSTKEMDLLTDYCRKEDIPFFLLGKGSNILVGDKGIPGVVAYFGEEMSSITVKENMIIAEAGATLAAVANTALQKGLTGFEFAAGIPGSVGGALRMNAGAYGGEMSQVVEWVRVLAPDGEIKTLTNEEMRFSYRFSVLQEVDYIALAAGILLEPGDEKAIRMAMFELANRRKEKQPLEYPSAGSTFKRPEGYFAGKLISEAGLSGVRIHDVVVSEKHNGFIVNEGCATAEDVQRLIEIVRRKVYEQSGVLLEPEIIMVGE